MAHDSMFKMLITSVLASKQQRFDEHLPFLYFCPQLKAPDVTAVEFHGFVSVPMCSECFSYEQKILIYDSVSRFTHSLFTSLPTSPVCICTAASGISGPWCYRCSQMQLIRPSPQIKDRVPDSGCEPFQLF